MANFKSWFVFAVTIAAVNDGERFPKYEVDDGVLLVIRAMPTNTGVVYLANSIPNTINIASRVTLSAGEGIGLSLDNVDAIYGAVATAGDGFEIFGESGKSKPDQQSLPGIPSERP